MTATPIPFCDLARAHAPLRADIERAITRCIDRSSYLRGPETTGFEEEWAAFCGTRYAVMCNSGTDALTIAAAALGQEEAHVPATTLPLTPLGLHRGGTRVTLDDVGDDGWPLRPTPSTVQVLFYGRLPRPQDPVSRLYDAAHAHGWKPPAASAAAWSFYPTKSLGALGDGGGVTTNDEGFAETMRDLCGRDDVLRDGRQLTSRMDEIQAAVLRVKLRHLDQWLAMRRDVAARYDRRLGPLGITLAGPSLQHLYCVRVADRGGLQARLAAAGIGTKVHWATPLHRQAGPWPTHGHFPGAERWCAEVVSLPCFPGLLPEEVERVCDVVEAALSGS